MIYGLVQTTSNLPHICVNKSYWDPVMSIHLHSVCGCFPSELSSWSTDPTACKTENIYRLSLYRKKFADLSVFDESDGVLNITLAITISVLRTGIPLQVPLTNVQNRI